MYKRDKNNTKSIAMNTLKFELEDNTVWMEIDGENAGFLEVADEGCNNYRIENTEIEPAFRGKKLYAKLISAAMTLLEIESLMSNNRNSNSNPVWEHWTGEDLDFDSVAYVNLGDSGLLEFITE